MTEARHFAFELRDIVPHQRSRIALVRTLNLKHHQPRVAETHFGPDKIKFLHPAELFTVQFVCFSTVGGKTLFPMSQSLSVMQAQDLDIGDQQAAAFNRRNDFGHRVKPDCNIGQPSIRAKIRDVATTIYYREPAPIDILGQVST